MSKRYLVTGVHPVHGTAPGETFEADISEELEWLLVEGHAIRVVPSRKTPRVRGELEDGDLSTEK